MVRKGENEDIEKWMKLVKAVSDGFPGLETAEQLEEHRKTVLGFIERGEAICYEAEDAIKGVLLYSTKNNMICCLAVCPMCRGTGIASALLREALEMLDRTRDISVSTFLESDSRGLVPRSLYTKFGFVPEEETVEFGCKNQVFRRHSRVINEHISLVPYYPNDEVSLVWYQDKELCKQVDDVDHVYDIELLHAMYSFLSSKGACFYIQYDGELVGDCSLRDDSEVAIVISRPYQNRHIGRSCIEEMKRLAAEKGMSEIKANIYSFNVQSQKMFLAAGFVRESEEWFSYKI